YPLAIAVVPNDAVVVKWKWDRSRVGDALAARLLAEFKFVLGQIVRSDIGRVGEIALPGTPRHEPLAAHRFQPVAARIAARSREMGDRRAVVCDGEALDYATLEAWSNRIGRRLKRLGAGPEDRVGLCMERSPALIASLLGILKSGAAFVPLDPAYPESRLAEMMDDACIRWLVADASIADRHGDLMKRRDIVRADDVADEPVQAWYEPVHPEQLAYVIYTSGSTGKPKGVAISHGALSRHLDDFLAIYRITDADRQLQSSTINFDVALHEMLPALIQGGQVVMRGRQPWDLRTINQRLVEERVTFARIPTAYWQQWLREPPQAAELSLRQITVGGEALPGDALAQWRAGPLSHIRLDNLYGPTETTVACTYRETRQSDTEHVAAPIGKPYPSRNACILDLDGNEVPAGGLGELCIGGATLARGYHDRPALTAERFAPDPYDEAGGRLYRTGDLCRRQEDGTVEFLGRVDQQVKLRGFRIEPGEIEMALRAVPGVKEAAVELRGEGDDKRLVGYIVGDAVPEAARDALVSALPQYMVPSALVVLPALPLLPSGKVDRKALPDAGDVRSARQATGPSTQMEAKLLSIWREVLQRDDIGVTDNFFEVGGDSLKALTVASLANRHRIADFSLESLFSHQTVGSLAAHLDAKSPHMPSNLFPLNAPSGRYNLFAVHPGYGLVAEYRTLAKHVEGVANLYGIQSPLYTEPAWWPKSLVEMARDYVERIRRVQPSGPYHLLGWSSGGWVAREMAFVLEAMGEEVAFLGMVDSSPRDREAMAAIAPDAATDIDAYPRSVSQEEIDALLQT
ncbi:MAG: amino acid adenylation domain-containing protein, partial [Pollutimonas bauzanensis]